MLLVHFLIAIVLFSSNLVYATEVTTSARYQLIQRSSSSTNVGSMDQIPINTELSSIITAQIRLRIHTQITSKISAKIFQKVKTSLSISASVMGSSIQVKNAEIEAIQTATVNGLQSQISQVVEKKIDQILSEKITPSIDQLLPSSNKTSINVSTLSKILTNAETVVRSEIQVTLPEIQKTLKKCIHTQLKANIKDVQVDIPGLLKIQISAKINVTSSVKTVVRNVYKSYANVSVAIAVQSYVKSIQKLLLEK